MSFQRLNYNNQKYINGILVIFSGTVQTIILKIEGNVIQNVPCVGH